MCNLRIKLGDRWHNDSGVSVIGAGFGENRLYHGASLAAYFHKVNNFQEFIKRVQKLNGFFAVVCKCGNEYYAAVDRVRSYPLFYSQRGDMLYLSDDPYWIQEEAGETGLDFISLAELLLAGYVTGSQTLDPKIAQIQAGEVLSVKNEGSKIKVTTTSHYRFCHYNLLASETSQLAEMHDQVIQAAIQRMLHFADGRLIAIPLSGGLDSRLIAITVKRLGYDNVCAFSYGVPGNAESRVSQAVASELGIPWQFVPYSRDDWAKWRTSKEWGDYIRFAERLTSLAHFQDWPAVMQLRFNGVLEEQAVIVPGHSGDFLAGKQIPPTLLRRNVHGTFSDEVANAVWKRHYNLRTIASVARLLGLDKKQLTREILKRIKSHFIGFDLQTPEGRIDAFDYEFWQEWLSKVLVNSMRVYEFWGMSWWLPFYDAEYVDFWQHVPLKHRLHKSLYNSYIEAKQKELGITIGAFGPSLQKDRIKSWLSMIGIWEFVYKLYWLAYRCRRSYFDHSLGWYGIVDYTTYSNLLRWGGNFNTLVTLDQARRHLSS